MAAPDLAYFIIQLSATPYVSNDLLGMEKEIKITDDVSGVVMMPTLSNGTIVSPVPQDTIKVGCDFGEPSGSGNAFLLSAFMIAVVDDDFDTARPRIPAIADNFVKALQILHPDAFHTGGLTLNGVSYSRKHDGKYTPTLSASLTLAGIIKPVTVEGFADIVSNAYRKLNEQWNLWLCGRQMLRDGYHQECILKCAMALETAVKNYCSSHPLQPDAGKSSKQFELFWQFNERMRLLRPDWESDVMQRHMKVRNGIIHDNQIPQDRECGDMINDVRKAFQDLEIGLWE